MPSHIIMNFPSGAVEFCSALNQLRSSSSPHPNVLCYSFSKQESAEEQLREARETLREALGWVPDVKVRRVRDVAPGKTMVCYSFPLGGEQDGGDC